MKKRQLSRRERDMMEEAITRVCKAMGIPEKDPELRQVAWAALLDVYRDDPAGFTGGRMRGWRRAYRLAWDALEAEKKDRWRSLYQLSLDKPLGNDTENILLQLLHSPSGGFENSVCLYEYLQRQHPDVRRVAMGMMEGETLEQLRGCYRWSWDHTYWAFNQLRAAMEEYLRI